MHLCQIIWSLTERRMVGFANWNTLAARLEESGQPARGKVSEDATQPAIQC
jgi:hypothetical protein